MITRDVRLEIEQFILIDILFNVAIQTDEQLGQGTNGMTKNLIVNQLWNRLQSIDLETKLGDIGALEQAFVLSPNSIFTNNTQVPLIFQSIGYDIETFNGYTPVQVKIIKK